MNAGVVVRRLLTTALTCLAFWNSYTHTVDWFEAHGQAQAASVLALIPEAGLILALLFLASGQLSTIQRWLVALVGCGSIGITISANLAGAQGGTEKVAALVAPVFAILGFALEITGPDPVAKTTSKADPGPVSEQAGDRTPIARPVEPRPPETTGRDHPETTKPVVPKPTPVKPRPPAKTGPKATKKATDAQVRDHIQHLIHTKALPPNPGVNELLMSIRNTPYGRGKAWCSAHAKDLAAQAEASAQQAG